MKSDKDRLTVLKYIVNPYLFSRIRLLISYLFTQQIYDGPSESYDILLKASLNETIPSSILTSTNKALIVFAIDGSDFLSGFDATYSVDN